MWPGDVGPGKVIVGDAGEHVLVQEVLGPIPSVACWAPYRFTGRCLRTGRTVRVVVPLTGAAEVLELPERVLEFIGRQDDELLLWDVVTERVSSVPASQSGPAASALTENTPVRVRLYAGEPVWVTAPA